MRKRSGAVTPERSVMCVSPAGVWGLCVVALFAGEPMSGVSVPFEYRAKVRNSTSASATPW
jgi:hypothetical protein